MSKYSTYATMARWLKWSSLFILLIPIAYLILFCVNKWGTAIQSYESIVGGLEIALLVLSAIWIVLNIILFFTAGTVKNKASPMGIRIGLLFSFVLVMSPLIVGIVEHFTHSITWEWLDLLLPLIVVIGYMAGFSCAKAAQLKTE